MKNVIIYGRVSTDEQALTGYSLPDQFEKLEKYCAHKGYNIVLKITEDYSAKTFDRPAFNKVLEFIKQNKGLTNLFLVSKWSRFSRNTSESYQVINNFRKLGIEVNAIEQPIDWNIPQNKYLLAFYLTEPEVDNDMRSKSVIDGMRRANKEGRYLGQAPRGYKNSRDESNKPIIIPNEKAKFVEEAFEMMVSGAYTQAEILKHLNENGFGCSRAQFSIMLTNRLYVGQVYVKPLIDEVGYWVQGIHPALVLEDIFDRVQNILTNRRVARKSLKVKTRDANLPLRGFLECNSCGMKMTGSKSKGNGGNYYYYHCNHCGSRHKAETVNNALLKEFEQIEFDENVKELYLEVIKDVLKGSDKERQKEIQHREEEVKKYESRLERLFDEKVDGAVSNEDYQNGKKRYSERIATIKYELEGYKSIKPEFETYLRSSFTLLQSIRGNYEAQDIDGKQQLIGSIFPELMIFEENGLRTKRVNEIVQLITTFNKASRGAKKKTGRLKSDLSRMVPGAGVEPACQ